MISTMWSGLSHAIMFAAGLIIGSNLLQAPTLAMQSLNALLIIIIAVIIASNINDLALKAHDKFKMKSDLNN